MALFADDEGPAVEIIQGASLAMEDAVTLAQCLRDLPDTERAFVAYEQMRKRRFAALDLQPPYRGVREPG